MENTIKTNNNEIKVKDELGSISEVTEELLLDARSSLESKKTISVPIGELSSLGAGVSSLIPSLRTITTTTTFSTGDKLYKIANQVTGDALKMAKDGTAWGAMKTQAGKSKMVKLAEAGPLFATSQAVVPLDPATMLMAVALYSIEKDLGEIAKTQKQILSFMQFKDEADIEGDLEAVNELLTNYKYNWDNKMYVSNSLNMVMEIKRTARKHMISHQKQITEFLSSKKLLVGQGQVKEALSNLEKKFKYYRLSLYTYSLASMMEIMLSGTYKEGYIAGIRNEITELSGKYKNLFNESSVYIEKLGDNSVEFNVVKGLGMASKTVGKMIGSIPFISEGPVDELLQEGGNQLKKTAKEIKMDAVHQFASLSNSGIHVFVDKMDDMIQIYNHTEEICFDDKEILLVVN